VTGRRLSLEVTLVVTALLLQLCVVNRLPLPAGRPDLLAVVVVALALVGGSQRGAVIGFATGLGADLLPPADHVVGQLAVAYTVIGYLAGKLEDAEQSSVLTTIAAVAVGSAAAVLMFAVVGKLVGDVAVTSRATTHALVAVVVYDVVLAPFVVPFVSVAARRLEPVGPR
jgi:rod shape-determining protein MreD